MVIVIKNRFELFFKKKVKFAWLTSKIPKLDTGINFKYHYGMARQSTYSNGKPLGSHVKT